MLPQGLQEVAVISDLEQGRLQRLRRPLHVCQGTARPRLAGSKPKIIKLDSDMAMGELSIESDFRCEGK